MTNRFLIVCGGAGVGLLGQRVALDLDGELHIDLSANIDDALARNDPRSIHLKLDTPTTLASTGRLLLDMKRRAQDPNASPQHRNHSLFLAGHWAGVETLTNDLQGVPAFGFGAIRQAENAADLDAKLTRMVDLRAQDAGSLQDFEFWIVSSTAGGTGEGIHRYVAGRVIDILAAREGARARLNFVRIGQATYNSVDPDRTALNTLLGVAADAAFRARLRRDYYFHEQVIIIPRWFYLEVPDVGVGSAAKPIREKLVESATKALMLEELQECIDTIVVNDGIGLVRVGCWGSDFDRRLKYHETLKQLRDKLNDLIWPDWYAKYVLNRPDPDFDPGQRLRDLRQDLAREDFIHQQILEGWEFPRDHRQRLPAEWNDIWRLVRRWSYSINQLVPSISVEALEPRFVVAQAVPWGDGDELGIRQAPLSVSDLESVEPYTRSWFEKIDSAHRVLAWASYLLGAGQDEEGLLAELLSLAKACYRAQYPPFPTSLLANSQKKARSLRKCLPDFVETLVKVTKLCQLREAAANMLEAALDGSKKLQEVVEGQLQTAGGAIMSVRESPVIAAELDHELDQITKDTWTWLRMLDEARRRDQPELFREQVIAGATGLSYAGLLSVLGLRPSGSAADVKSELRQHMGRMHDAKNKECQAQWWGATLPAGIVKSFRFRIMPRLAPAVRSDLGDGDGEITYLYTELRVIGLYVLAFEGLKLATVHDTVTTPAYLLSPSVNLVKDYLDDDAWEIEGLDGYPVNKLSIVCAGVGGDVLYKPALIKAGLTEQELEKLSEFYELYDPLEDFRTLSSARCVT